MQLAQTLADSLLRIPILPRRFLLDTPGVEVTTPMLRGVWGAALHDSDLGAYQAVFSPPDGNSPGYLLRPAPPDPQFAPAVDWILVGAGLTHEPALLRAWIIACRMGLGKQRQPFRIPQARGLRPDGTVAEDAVAWRLGEASWPLAVESPCRLVFPAPLRIMRRDRLIREPTLTDLTVAACRRFRSFLPAETLGEWDRLADDAIAASHEIPQGPWVGDRLDLLRYSARQEREVQINGVSGWLDLPAGPGPLWPLLAAAQWLHLGKSTVIGLGQLQILPVPRDANARRVEPDHWSLSNGQLGGQA